MKNIRQKKFDDKSEFCSVLKSPCTATITELKNWGRKTSHQAKWGFEFTQSTES